MAMMWESKLQTAILTLHYRCTKHERKLGT